MVVFLNFVLTVVIVVVIAGGAGLFIGKMQFDRAGSLDQARPISIERGSVVIWRSSLLSILMMLPSSM